MKYIVSLCDHLAAEESRSTDDAMERTVDSSMFRNVEVSARTPSAALKRSGVPVSGMIRVVSPHIPDECLLMQSPESFSTIMVLPAEAPDSFYSFYLTRMMVEARWMHGMDLLAGVGERQA